MNDSQSQEPLLDNFYFFRMFVEITVNGSTFVGYPKRAILDTGKKPPVLRWGSPVELSWPNKEIPRALWIDDPTKGLLGRAITRPEDLLGSEGLLGDKRYRFERVLDVGKNQVVFSLFCSDNHTRVAYGFPREMFKVGSERTDRE